MRSALDRFEQVLERLVLDHPMEMIVAVLLLAPLLPLVARYAGRLTAAFYLVIAVNDDPEWDRLW